jgi:iron(II)-dependent oxidoreductase
MQKDAVLGQLNGLQQMLPPLVEALPPEACYTIYHPRLAPLAWYLGRAGYIESYWLREVVQGEDDLTARVRSLFAPGTVCDENLIMRLPPFDHLLNWLLEMHDENIMRLANPRLLPDHPLLENNRLLFLILQAHAGIYEQMLQVLNARQLQLAPDYSVEIPLQAHRPRADPVAVPQGHYRIGAVDDPACQDDEQPPQMVQLSAFRMAAEPVTNAQYLAFMQAGGYEAGPWWDEPGRQWLKKHPRHPWHWRQDSNRQWYGISISGPADLVADAPLTGITQHEAKAYANWVSSLGGELSGAVVQHEYQWEAAVRTGAIKRQHQATEWCANLYAPYSQYQPPTDAEEKTTGFNGRHYSLRGASLHSQPIRQRASQRGHALPDTNYLFCGTRLVFPPC